MRDVGGRAEGETYLSQDVCCCKAREGYCDVEPCTEGDIPWAAHSAGCGLCSVPAVGGIPGLEGGVGAMRPSGSRAGGGP